MTTQTLNAFTQARRDASSDAFGGRREHSPTDLLPPKSRSALRQAAATWPLQRTARAQHKWWLLLGKATENADALGFVAVPDGGTTALAPILGTSPGSVTKSLAAWTDKGAVEQFRQERDRGLPVLVGIQVPELTWALTWLADRAYFQLQGTGGGGAPMTIPQARKIAGNLLAHRVPMPHEVTTFGQAAALLDRIAAGALEDGSYVASIRPTRRRGLH